jgi:hypothetical protein
LRMACSFSGSSISEISGINLSPASPNRNIKMYSMPMRIPMRSGVVITGVPLSFIWD